MCGAGKSNGCAFILSKNDRIETLIAASNINYSFDAMIVLSHFAATNSSGATINFTLATFCPPLDVHL